MLISIHYNNDVWVDPKEVVSIESFTSGIPDEDHDESCPGGPYIKITTKNREINIPYDYEDRSTLGLAASEIANKINGALSDDSV